jgi:hypothetical protein
LDWIVMKCLEKDRTRRYETANGLALDIEWHLHDEPVSAQPPSRLHRFQKLVRRNKLAFAAAAAVTAALVVGIVVSTWQAIEARRARNAESAQRLAAQAARREAETSKRSEHQERLHDVPPLNIVPVAQIAWPALVGVNYGLETAPTVQGPWQPVPDPMIPAMNQTTKLFGDSMRFYHLIEHRKLLVAGAGFVPRHAGILGLLPHFSRLFA